MQKLSNIYPAPVRESGALHLTAGDKLFEAARNLVGHAQELAGIWGGDAATKHLEQIQKLHDTALGLADASYIVGDAYTWLGSEKMMGWYRDMGTKLQGDDAYARSFQERYFGRIADAYNYHPTSVSVDLPVPGKSLQTYGPAGPPGIHNPGGIPSGGPGGKLPSGKLPGGGPPGGGLPSGGPPGGLPRGGKLPGGGLPGGGSPGGLPGGHLPGGGTHLQNFTPPGGGGSGGLGGIHPGGGGGLPGGGAGGLPGSGLTGAGSGSLSGGALNDALAAERAAMGGAGANGMGGMGMPMGGGGHGGGGSEDRERSTWLAEDEDIWGGDGDTAPPVIG